MPWQGTQNNNKNKNNNHHNHNNNHVVDARYDYKIELKPRLNYSKILSLLPDRISQNKGTRV